MTQEGMCHVTSSATSYKDENAKLNNVFIFEVSDHKDVHKTGLLIQSVQSRFMSSMDCLISVTKPV